MTTDNNSTGEAAALGDLRSKFRQYLLAEGCDFNHNVKAMAVEMAYMAEHHYAGVRADERTRAATERVEEKPSADLPWHGNGPCDDCGGANIRWSAPFEIWDSVMDCEPGVSTGGIKCPQCFVRRAWDKGLTDVNWSLVPVPKGFSVKVPVEGRVVPRYHYFTGDPQELMRQWYATFIGTDGRVRESAAAPPVGAVLDPVEPGGQQ